MPGYLKYFGGILLFCLSACSYFPAPDSPGPASRPNPTPAPAPAVTSGWYGSWAASPMEGTDTAFSQAARFENQTVRMVVHGSLGGSRLRVRLSNDYGEGDLLIGTASVALQEQGAAVKPATHRNLTFGGEESITIPEGAFVFSDPVDLESGAFSNYVVSMYFPELTGAATNHAGGLQTSYISDVGNYTGTREFPVLTTTQSVFFVSGVEVFSSSAKGVVVALGDSITDGTGSSADTNQRWPNLFARRLADSGTLRLGVLNQGIAGNRLLHDTIGDSAPARFERDALSWENLEYIVLMIGINDIGFSAIENFPFGDDVDNGDVSANELIAGYRQLITRAHSRGVLIYGATLTPFGGASYFTEAGEAKRQAVNQWIRESGEFDGVIDFDEALRDPENPRRMREDLHAGDWLHPNDAGYAVMAEAIDLSLFQ